MSSKICSKCKLDLPLGSFYRDPTKATGRKSHCKPCVRGVTSAAGRWSNLDNFEADDQLVAAVMDGGDALIAFGTPLERASAESLLRCGGIVEAAMDLQLTPQQLRAHLSELQRRAASRGFSPAHDMTKTAPEGFHVKGTSTLYTTDPNTGERKVSSQWVKTKADEQHRFTALLDALHVVAEPLRALAEPIRIAAYHDDDLLCVYPLGDPHLGMMAWPAETGNAFDIKIAENNLFTAVDQLVALAPNAAHAIVMNLGDFFHSDNKDGTTTRGTKVDVDGRWPKVLAAGIRVMRRLIDRALEKHAHVTVVCEIGNHDDHTSIMLSIALAQFYENEPRVTVDTSPEPFHWFRFGKVLIGVHHGDKTKTANLLGVMACDRAKDWGETEHRYWYIGHVHHDTLKELPGVTVESFRTLAGRDAWHHGQGYRSGRDMKLDVIHRERGKINRHIIGISHIEAIVKESA